MIEADQKGRQTDRSDDVDAVAVERLADDRRAASMPGQAKRRECVGQSGERRQHQSAHNQMPDMPGCREMTLDAALSRSAPTKMTTVNQTILAHIFSLMPLLTSHQLIG